MANPEVAYEHTGTAAPTQLAAPITDTDGTFTVIDGTGYPTGAGGDFFITIDGTNSAYERILCSGRVGNVFTVAASGRGADATVARDHSISAPVEHTWSAVEATQLSAHISSTKNVHGVSSDIVGVDDAQTMQNKTLVEPTIASFVNADHDHSNAANGGAVPQASITGLVTALANLSTADSLRQLLSEKGAANGYASLDAGVKVPFAQLPSGTGGSQVAIGNHTHAYSSDTHTHSLGTATRTNGLTERTFSDGDPVRVLASLVVPAGRYLVIAECKGLTAAANDNTGFQYDVVASGASSNWVSPVTVRKSSTGLGEGVNMTAIVVCAGSQTIEFTGEKLGNGALLTNSTIGQLIAIPLNALEID